MTVEKLNTFHSQHNQQTVTGKLIDTVEIEGKHFYRVVSSGRILLLAKESWTKK